MHFLILGFAEEEHHSRSNRSVSFACGTSDRRQVDSSASDRRQVDSRPSDRRQVDSSPSDRRKVDSSSSNQRQVDSSPSDRRQVDSSSSDRRQVDSSPSERRQVDSSPSDRRQVDSSLSDRRQVDSSPSDRRQLDSSPSEERKIRIGRGLTVNSKRKLLRLLIRPRVWPLVTWRLIDTVIQLGRSEEDKYFLKINFYILNMNMRNYAQTDVLASAVQIREIILLAPWLYLSHK